MSRTSPDSELYRIGFGVVLFALLAVGFYFNLHVWLAEEVVAPLLR